MINTILNVIRVHRPFWKGLKYLSLLEGPDGMQAPPELLKKDARQVIVIRLVNPLSCK